jgi:hypothetical protein
MKLSRYKTQLSILILVVTPTLGYTLNSPSTDLSRTVKSKLTLKEINLNNHQQSKALLSNNNDLTDTKNNDLTGNSNTTLDNSQNLKSDQVSTIKPLNTTTANLVRKSTKEDFQKNLDQSKPSFNSVYKSTLPALAKNKDKNPSEEDGNNDQKDGTEEDYDEDFQGYDN